MPTRKVGEVRRRDLREFANELLAADLSARTVSNVLNSIQAFYCWAIDCDDQVEGVIEPKSTAGRRRVPLLAILRDYLDEHLLRTGRSGEDLLFGRTLRQAFYASTVDGRAKRAWKAANEREHETAEAEERDPDLLEPLSLHACRHTFASLLIDAGTNPKAIQQFMGHSKIQTTFDVYGHLLPGSHDEVRERVTSVEVV